MSNIVGEDRALLFAEVQQIYVVLEGREILSHEALSEAYSTMMPSRNVTKFFAVKQILAEFDEASPLGPGLSTFPFNLDIEPTHKKPPSFLLSDLPLRHNESSAEGDDGSAATSDS